MVKRVITKMPIWGLSLLAVGSIGAPLPGTGKTDIRPNRNFSMSPAVGNPFAPALQNSQHIGHPHSRPRNYTQSLGSSAVAPQRSTLSAGTRSGMKSDDALKPIIAASAMPLKSMTDAGTSQPSQFKNDFESPTIVNALPDGIFAPIQLANNRSIYGTSANNAYKVYFPQIEPPALGIATEDLQTFNGAPDNDDRVLKKNGSYHFYVAQTDAESAKKIETGLKSDGNLDAETIAQAVAKLGKGKAEENLTAPPLQKKPLVFGESLFQTSEQPPEGNSETPAADQNDETIETAEY